MEPAKKLNEDKIPALSFDAAHRALLFESLYLRARIEIANANKGIRRLQRVVEARDKVIQMLEAELERRSRYEI